jgi:hypothetical protein
VKTPPAFKLDSEDPLQFAGKEVLERVHRELEGLVKIKVWHYEEYDGLDEEGNWGNCRRFTLKARKQVVENSAGLSEQVTGEGWIRKEYPSDAGL